MKPTISKPFKSNDRTFDKVYNAFDKRDYFNSQGLAKVQIGNFERALKKNDKGAQQVLDLFKGDEKKAKDYITQVVSDRNKERAFNNYKALKSAVDSIQKGKPNVGAVDYVKRIIHNSSQKYSIALYSTLRNKKFTKWKDVHNDIDSLIGESVNEGKFKPSQVRSAISRVKKQLMRKWKQKGGYENFGQKELRQLQNKFDYNAYGDKDEREISHMLDAFDNWAMNYDGNMREAYVVLYAPKKGVKPVTTAAYKDKKDAEKWAKDLGGITMIVKKKVKGIDESLNEAKEPEVISQLRDIVKGKQNKKIKDPKSGKMMRVDLYSASAITKVYDAINKSNKDKFGKLSLPKMVNVAFSVIKKESVNEAKYYNKADALTAYFKGKIDAKELDKIARNDFKSGIATKKELSNFLSNKFTQDVMSDTYGIPTGTLVKRVRGLMKFAEGVTEDKNQITQLKKQVGKKEIKFYDALSNIEKKLGSRYKSFLDKALKDFKQNPNSFKTIADKEEKLFQIS